jgi:hypothetical protein
MNKTRALPTTALTDALEAFSDALEAAGVDPRVVEVSLPLSEWRHVVQILEDEAGNSLPGDVGRVEIGGVPSDPLRGEGAVTALHVAFHVAWSRRYPPGVSGNGWYSLQHDATRTGPRYRGPVSVTA